jgi:signal peptidase I
MIKIEDKDFYFAQILSNSMSPTIQLGDKILLKKNSILKKGDVVGIINKRNIPLIHRLVDFDNNFLFTIADGSFKADQKVNRSALRGRVSMIKIDGVWIDCNSSIILKIYFFVIQHLSKKVVLYPKNRITVVLRKLVADQIRAIFFLFAKRKKIVNSIFKNRV